MHFNIILPCMLRSSEWCLTFSNQNFWCTSHYYRVLYAPPISFTLIQTTNYGAPHYAFLSSLQVQIFPYMCSQTTLNLQSSVNVKGQVSYPYNATGKIIVM
jgi:hypothetical protein